MSKTTIPAGGITDSAVTTAKINADAVTAAKIADDAISEEHIDATAITGSTELAATPADTDEILISDAGTLKRIDFSHLDASKFKQVATVSVTSAQGALTFASCFTSTYQNYFVIFNNLKVATNGADVNMLFHYGDSNGNDSSNHNYSFIRRYPSSTDATNENNANDIKFLQAQKSGAGHFAHGTMYVFNPLSTTDGVTSGTILSQGNTNDGTGAQMTVLAFNMPEAGSNSAYTGFQFSASTGNIQGDITVYGIVNPS
jgi:hypothetical protein